MANYFVKLPLSFLDDPKIGRLPDWVFRCFIEFYLFAKENNRDGELQPVADMAWRIRQSEETVNDALRTLLEIGVVHTNAAGEWVISNFAQQQESSDATAAERMARFRKHKTTQEVAAQEEGRDTVNREEGRVVTRNVTRNETGEVTGALRVEREGDIEGERERERENLEPADDQFVMMQVWLESCIGLPIKPDPKEINAVNQLVEAGVLESDIRDAIAWRNENNSSPARSAVQLLQGCLISKAKRIQAEKGRRNGKNGQLGPKSYKIPDYLSGDELENTAGEDDSQPISTEGQAWEKVKEQVKPGIQKGNFEKYIVGTRVISSDGAKYIVGAPTQDAVTWLQACFKAQAGRQLTGILGREMAVDFRVGE